jgi:NADPH2:quinone reductase
VRAVICNELGNFDLSVEELESPTADKGQVVIEVKASSLNFPDVLLVQGKYQFKPGGAFSPGGDFSGVIKEVGQGVDNLSVGDHVVAAMPWGAWREEVLMDPAKVVKIPKSIDLDVAASFLCTYGTSYYALEERAQLKEGESLVVLGASGGIGMASIELGKLMGAKVVACAASDDKLALCKEHGADEVINYATEDLKKQIKKLTGGGADVTIDPVGGEYSEPAIRAMAWGGRHLVIGFAGNDIPRIPLNLVLLKSCSLVGVFWGQHTMREAAANAANVEQLISWLDSGELKPLVSKRYRFDEASQALRDMVDRKVRGKVVVVP